MKLQEVRESALALPRCSREKLLKELLQSLGDEILHECPPGVLSEDDPNLARILQERIDAYDRGEDKGVPWEKVRAKMEARIKADKIAKRRRTRTI